MDEYFDQKYYYDIWGTIHRHDYCETRANELIAKYGTCRILDIGTGCGHLVKVLREKGCDAWGIDISQYALQNSCCPGYVLHGSVTHIPFQDNYFDVVHSNGLWEYIPRTEVRQGAYEIHRVGRHQEHNIDYRTGITPSMKAITYENHDWWMSMLKPPLILIACPTHEVKEYAMQRWLDNVSRFTYPNLETMVIDNSPNLDLYDRWKGKMGNKIHIEHLTECEQEPDMCRRIAISMEHIRKRFVGSAAYKWLNLEIDVLPEDPDIVQNLLKWGGDADWIAHTYPGRIDETEDPVQSGVGCSMFSRQLMENIDFNQAGFDKCPDAWLWDKIRPMNKYRTIELWSFSKMKHIGK